MSTSGKLSYKYTIVPLYLLIWINLYNLIIILDYII